MRYYHSVWGHHILTYDFCILIKTFDPYKSPLVATLGELTAAILEPQGQTDKP